MSAQAVQFFAAAFVSYLGLPAGFLLASLTREELPTARKFFPLLQRIVLVGVAAAAMDFFSVAIAARAFAYFALLVVLLLPLNLPVTYAALGAIAALAANDQNFLLIATSLTFAFGLLSGSSYSQKKPAFAFLAAAGLAFFAAAAVVFLIIRH